MERIIDSFAILSSGEIVYQASARTLKEENKNLEAIYFEYVKNDLAGDIEWLGG